MPCSIESGVAVNIYGDKIAVLIWSDPVALVIKNKKLANAFREYFRIIWKSTKK